MAADPDHAERDPEMPVAIVPRPSATGKAPATVSTADSTTAGFGFSAPVATAVANNTVWCTPFSTAHDRGQDKGGGVSVQRLFARRQRLLEFG